MKGGEVMGRGSEGMWVKGAEGLILSGTTQIFGTILGWANV